jgi:hypothetical protein
MRESCVIGAADGHPLVGHCARAVVFGTADGHERRKVARGRREPVGASGQGFFPW